VSSDVARGPLRRVQTPQGFDRAALEAGHHRLEQLGSGFTDDATLVMSTGVAVATVDGDELAAKVTVPHDLRLAELLAADR
jgi:2-C-methyl-D-erythritol 4-phosphate cytidylyltransferase